MLKIKQKYWRRGVRLILKMIFVVVVLFVLYGVVFGVSRGVGANDGSLLLFCRVCREYGAGDVVVVANGEAVEYEDNNEDEVIGKMIAKLTVRGFESELNK